MKGNGHMKTKSTKTFLADVPAKLEILLRKEAATKRRSRNAQLVRILEERYGLAAEDAAQSQPAEAQAA